MNAVIKPPGRKRGRGMRLWLIQLKTLGLIGFLGGLLTLAVIALRSPAPDSLAGWQVLRDAMRTVFWPCVFGGLLVTILAGILLYAQHPKVFRSRRWFRLKFTLIALFVPTMHLWARGRVTAFYDAIELGLIADLPRLMREVGIAYAAAFAIFLVIAAIGKIKPRLGQPILPRETAGKEVTGSGGRSTLPTRDC